MTLALHAPLAPMEARTVDQIPVGEGWQYEPKWDGFRCIAFLDHGKVELQSKACQSLTRYFPELAEAIGGITARHGVLDGEIVVPDDGDLSFDALLQRIHAAPSRIARLARETPAVLIVFDLLAGEDGASLLRLSLQERRRKLERFAAKHFPIDGRLRLSPVATRLKDAQRWHVRAGGGEGGQPAGIDRGASPAGPDGLAAVQMMAAGRQIAVS